MDIKSFVATNIKDINRKITSFRRKPNGDCDYEFSDLEIKEYLSKKFFSDIQKNATRQKLAKRLDDFNYVKARIENIANEEVYYKTDLVKYYNKNIFSEIFRKIDQERLVEKILSFISIDEKINDKQYRFISSDLKKILNKAILISSTKGFPIDLNNAESGKENFR